MKSKEEPSGGLDRQLADLREELERSLRSEESLRRSEGRYRTMFDIALDVFYVLSKDGTFESLNPAFEAITGWSRSDWLGKPIEDILHPEDFPEALGYFQLTLDGIPNRGFHLRVLCKSGDYLHGEFFTVPLLEDGRVVAVFGIARDITDRLRAEEALRESEARFRRLAENAPDVIFRFDLFPRRGFSYVSRSVVRMTGYQPEDFYADPDLPRKIMHPEDLPVFDETPREERCKPATWRWIHRDGSIVWTEHLQVPVSDEEGRLVAIEGIVRDVTERKELEEQLLRAQRLETAGRIAGQVAHDFNNLLGPLVAYPELIKMHLPDGHPAAQHCDAMMEAAERMAAINEDLMALGRRGHFDQENIGLNELVTQVVSQTISPTRGLRVQLELAGDLLPVTGSSAQLTRVISNLLSNAWDAMQEIGLLTVKTETLYADRPIGSYSRVQVGEYVRLSVSDTGCGIAPEIRARVFEPFFTTKNRWNRRGCGLGLSIVQAIVEDHQGYVDFESEVGRGTTFSVYLPASRVPLADGSDEVVLGGRESILVVDDDRLQREVSKELLARLGYRVEVVSSGREALAYLRQHPADLLILDMIMPGGLDGTETYRRVLEVRPGLKAIILSGFSESDRVREAQSLGAGAYLRKPVTFDRLARAVRKELDC